MKCRNRLSIPQPVRQPKIHVGFSARGYLLAARCTRGLEKSPSKGRGRPSKEGAGNAGCECTRSRACSVESTRVSHHEYTGAVRHPRAMIFSVSFALSLVIGLCCHHHWRDAKHHCQLDASVGASGPHDFAVRRNIIRLVTLPRSSHPVPNVRDDRETPLSWARDSGNSD